MLMRAALRNLTRLDLACRFGNGWSEEALLEALQRGHLGDAGLDVLAEEPPAPDDRLLSLDNIVLTPHVAWLTQETLARSFDVALENVRRLRGGRDLLHRIV